MDNQTIQSMYLKEREEKIDPRADGWPIEDFFGNLFIECLKRRGVLPRRVVKKKSSELILAAFNNWSATC